MAAPNADPRIRPAKAIYRSPDVSSRWMNTADRAAQPAARLRNNLRTQINLDCRLSSLRRG
jgi:hypothetical protein